MSRTTRYCFIISGVAVCLLCLLLTDTAMAQETGDPDREKWNELNQKAVSAYHAGKYPDSLRFAEQAYQFALDHFGEKDPDTLTSLNNLAFLYKSRGRYGEAEPLYQKVLSLRESVLGPEHPDTLISLNNLASLYKSQGRYGEAEPLYQKALSLSESVLGPEHPDTIGSLNNMAGLHRAQGRYGEAEPLYQKSLSLSQSVLGPEHPHTLQSLNNLAALYYSQGRYGEAEPLFQKALSVKESVLGLEHPSTLTSLNNLALLYSSQGRYGEAEPLFQKALSVKESVLGLEHPSTLISLNNLAFLYHSQGRYEEAEPLLRKTLSVQESVLGLEHPSTLTSLNNLAFLYSSQGRYGEAEPLFQKVLYLRESLVGLEHPDALQSLNDLAFLYSSQRRYGEAEPLYQKALSLRESVLGPEHPLTLTSLNNLAFLYSSQGRYGEAEPLFRKALSLHESALGPKHPNTLNTRLNYVGCLTTLERYDQALFQLKKAEAASLARTGHLLKTTLKQRVRVKHFLSNSRLQDVALTLASRYSPEGSKAFAGDVLLRWKEIQAEEDAYVAHLVQTTDDPEVRSLGRDLKNLRSLLTRLPFQEGGDNQRPKLLARLEVLELKLAGISREYKDALQVFNAGMDRVRYALPTKTALIEFRHFQPVDFKTGDFGDLHWAVALIYSEGSGDGLVFEDLGPVLNSQLLWKTLRFAEKKAEAMRIASNLCSDLRPAEDTLELFYKRTHQEHSSTAKGLSRELYQNLFAKFDGKLKDFDTLYIAPDGLLHQVAFSRLILPDGRYWAERHRIRRVHTGRDLVRQWQEGHSGKLIAMGGIDYDHHSDKAEVLVSHLEELKPKSGDIKRAGTALNKFDFLPASRKEVLKIKSIYKLRRGKNIETLYGSAANEGFLKRLKEGPAVLHLSTHGFFLPDDENVERPLALSGLALAGANQSIDNNPAPDRDDGLLFSMEVLGLNLQGTELVSLSACKTGIGKIDYSEGVYGLVRAFRVAGAKSVLMTLWPVNDSDAKDFMTLFYKYWLSQPPDQSDAALALHQTRLDYIDWGVDPDVWAPYVLVGE